jgi:hypothetical protein
MNIDARLGLRVGFLTDFPSKHVKEVIPRG